MTDPDDMNENRWRIIENEWNLKGAPWPGAIGIEEVNDALAVPGVVCWFTRGWDNKRAARQMVELHNAARPNEQHGQEEK